MKYRVFECTQCKQHMTFPKKRKDKLGHIKTVYCPMCKTKTDWELIDEM